MLDNHYALIRPAMSPEELDGEHTTLFPLEPIGLGTPYVEALSSYVVRLARAHSMTPITLVKYLRQQMEPLSSDRLRWKTISSQIDNLGEETSKWVEYLTKMTGVPNLQYLTTLPYRKIFSHKNLIHHKAVWCPLCLETWKKKSRPLYVPLLWRINDVTVCPIHKIKLSLKCSNFECQKQIVPVLSNTVHGYCPHCNEWLGQISATENGELFHQQLLKSQIFADILSDDSLLDVSLEDITQAVLLEVKSAANDATWSYIADQVGFEEDIFFMIIGNRV